MSVIRILYTVEERNTSSFGGTFKDLLNVLVSLDRSRFEPKVLLTGDESARPAFKRLNIPILHLSLPPFRKGKSILRIPRSIFKLQRILMSEKIHLVHINGGYNDTPYVALAARLVGIPSVVTIRSMVELREKFLPYYFKWVDHYVLTAKIMEVDLKRYGISDGHFETIYSGIDVGYFQDGVKNIRTCRETLGLPRRSPIIGMVANLAPIKGADYLIKAASILIKTFPNLLSLFVGGGDPTYIEQLRSLARHEGIIERVIFTGYKEDVRPYLNSMDICVLPSLDEAFGIALLEAMALEKPVVASRIGGIPEVVEDRITGLLVPPEDKKALAEAISFLLVNREKALRMGRAGRERVTKFFSLQTEIEYLQNFYLRITKRSLQ